MRADQSRRRHRQATIRSSGCCYNPRRRKSQGQGSVTSRPFMSHFAPREQGKDRARPTDCEAQRKEGR
eukprot:5690256-Heterocapsa_arctica.AAC.1